MWMPWTLLLLATGALSETVSRYTNLECKMMDPSWATFTQCELKILGRGVVGLNVYVKLHKPFNNAKVNLSLWRKYNGYRPFMFNTTFDFCKFMAKSNQKLSFEKIFIDSLSKTSNFNHTCPYVDDLVVRDMVFLEEHYKFMPLPSGQYKIQLIGGTNNAWTTSVTVHYSRQEDLLKS